MALPVAADVVNYLSQAAGVTVTSSAAITQLIAEALAELEEFTGYTPFLGAESEKRMQVDSNRFKRLRNGVYSVTAVGPAGSPWTAEVQYRFGPLERAGTSGEPYEWIELLTNTQTIITIDGKWGWGDDFPDVLKTALIQLAAGRLLESIRQGSLTEGVSWKEADTEETVAGGQTLGDIDERKLLGGPMITAAQRIFRKYRRTVAWGS